MSVVKAQMIREVFHRWRERQELITDETSSFYIFRTDNNQVLARGVVGYEAAKDKANIIRRRLNLKWDDIKFKKERHSRPSPEDDRRTRNKVLMSNPKYASPQRDRYSLSGSGGSRSYTHHKDWDE